MHSTFAVHHYRGNRVGVWHVTAGWIQAGNTPFQYYKQSSHRGGNADALEISWPKGIDKKYHGQIRTQYSHIIDIASTILKAAGVKAPKVIDGVEQMTFDGKALNYSVSDPKAKDSRTVQYYELFGNRAIYAELFINDKSVGKIHIAKTVPITYSIEETFDVGEVETGSDQGRTQLTAA